jgi:hypothetical protein
MLYIKAMKQDGTYQILEADGYVEFLKKDVGDKQSVQHAVEVVFNYYDLDGILRNGRHWLEGDCFIMNDKGFTVSAYHYKPDPEVTIYSCGEVHNGERSKEELDWLSSLSKQKKK